MNANGKQEQEQSQDTISHETLNDQNELNSMDQKSTEIVKIPETSQTSLDAAIITHSDEVGKIFHLIC